MAFLELSQVTKRYGERTVLDQVSLGVDEHQVVCLIGASGSGKSTLLRCVNGLEEVQGGEIRLGGEAVTGRWVDHDAVRRRVGIVFQSYNLFPHLSVLDNVTLGPRKVLRRRRRDAEAEGRELLARIGLADKAGEYPDRLSGGQQQRVAIVRALAMGPDLLLLDEVTSALDPELVGEVLDLLVELAAGGMTMVLATHEMGFAREVASTVCFLDAGRILEHGPPADVLDRPFEERTRAFLRRVLSGPSAPPPPDAA